MLHSRLVLIYVFTVSYFPVLSSLILSRSAVVWVFCCCFFAICCPSSAHCYIWDVLSCGNWLLTVKDLLTLKSVVCTLRAPCSLGQLQRLRWFESPNTCLLFPPSDLQKSRCAERRRGLGASSQQTQRRLMRDVCYPAAHSTACGKSLPGPGGVPADRACGPEAPFAAPLSCNT